jgi:ATP-dependent protease ClpP protease subunit
MPKRTWFTMAAGNSGKSAEITIYDLVGFWGVDSVAFHDELSSLGDVDTINLRINSPGGDVYQGVAIYNMLARHPANVIVTVDGLAASIASLIMLAGNEILIPENAAVLIHNPSGGVYGTADDMDQMATWLRQIGQGVTNTYVTTNRKSLPREEIEAMLSAETWMTAQTAVDKGFADRVIDSRDITAKFDLESFGFTKAPAALMLRPPEAKWTAAAAADQIAVYRVDPVENLDIAATATAILDAAGFKAGGTTPAPQKALACFLVQNLAEPAAASSYRYPIATLVAGEPRITGEALDAAAVSLAAAGDLSAELKAAADAVIADHRRALAIVKANTPPSTVTAAAVAEATRRSEVLAACELAGVTAKQANAFINGGKSLDVVRAELMALAAGGGGGNPELNPRHNPGGTGADGQATAAGWQKAIDRHNASRMHYARRA